MSTSASPLDSSSFNACVSNEGESSLIFYQGSSTDSSACVLIDTSDSELISCNSSISTASPAPTATSPSSFQLDGSLYCLSPNTSMLLFSESPIWQPSSTHTPLFVDDLPKSGKVGPVLCSTPKRSAGFVDNHRGTLYKRRRLTDELHHPEGNLSAVATWGSVHSNNATSASLSHLSDDSPSLSQLLANNCCGDRCLAHLSIVEAEHAREQFSSRTTVEQNQFLLDAFEISGKVNNSSASVVLEGKCICAEAFVSVLGISRKRYQKLLTQFRQGVTRFKRKEVNRTEATKVTEAKAWMTHFFNRTGDHMPHIQQVHLPHFLTKKDIYSRMKRELLQEGLQDKDIVCLSYFYRLWDTDYKHVVIPAVSSMCMEWTRKSASN